MLSLCRVSSMIVVVVWAFPSMITPAITSIVPSSAKYNKTPDVVQDLERNYPAHACNCGAEPGQSHDSSCWIVQNGDLSNPIIE
ncbi:hypothetical protein PGT21_022160 [Puccinia graminis f. sp. tritici]|uniref:Uncharacterized protein n=1 Tax=Puccinia graminis f. sp. tritici TaxID=56615 RepID=A0A5B0QWW0_PUCGR|nr:hypothetical protein PGTUg99_028588 [Puccinia graminis f. sp. tritici]KAA1099724.1 hypothetical protein PGT21_018598 [Puccinia graminis f. sp. tritici]KAA1117748.1 hypothetical protein PGT21_022160 [Puccinia graminis f. sp. tritici]KAA1138019.1 hypothetical protein PGTUg99_023063 [Puccinia graminis f. sp. tritici]